MKLNGLAGDVRKKMLEVMFNLSTTICKYSLSIILCTLFYEFNIEYIGLIWTPLGTPWSWLFFRSFFLSIKLIAYLETKWVSYIFRLVNYYTKHSQKPYNADLPLMHKTETLLCNWTNCIQHYLHLLWNAPIELVILNLKLF